MTDHANAVRALVWGHSDDDPHCLVNTITRLIEENERLEAERDIDGLVKHFEGLAESERQRESSVAADGGAYSALGVISGRIAAFNEAANIVRNRARLQGNDGPTDKQRSAMQEMTKIAQETGQYDGWGNDGSNSND